MSRCCMRRDRGFLLGRSPMLEGVTLNDTLKSIFDRRSIRRFTEQQVGDENLNTIVEAGLYAPNAGNRQTTVVLISKNREINEELGKINKKAFKGRISTADRFISKDNPGIADNPALESGLYGAPVVITLFGPKDFLYSVPDCWVMAENMALAAYSLGIGSCLIARAEDTFDTDAGQKIQNEAGIPSDYIARVHIALGYPENGFPKAKERKRKDERILVID